MSRPRAFAVIMTFCTIMEMSIFESVAIIYNSVVYPEQAFFYVSVNTGLYHNYRKNNLNKELNYCFRSVKLIVIR